MHKAAKGYSVIEHRKEFDEKGTVVKRFEIDKTFVPNVIAGIFLLKNEKPAQYKDKQDIEIGGTMKVLRIPDIQKPKGAGESTHIDNGD